jgi:hypothetical protein
MAGRHAFKMLYIAQPPARPLHRNPHRTGVFSEAEEDFLRVLGEGSRSRFQDLHLPPFWRLDGDHCADSIAVARLAAQAEGNGFSKMAHVVAKDSQLRPVAIL